MFWKKKGRKCPPERKSPPTTPGEDLQKKKYTIMGSWCVTTTPQARRRKQHALDVSSGAFYICVYRFFVVYASRKSNPRLQLFLLSLSLKEEEEEEENTKFIPI